MLFPRAPVVEDKAIDVAKGIDGWPLNPVLFGGPHVNTVLARLASSLPFAMERGKLVFFSASEGMLADKHAVRFLHVLICTNLPQPYGMGLWEGVPLREVFWKVEPKQNIRRIFYYC